MLEPEIAALHDGAVDHLGVFVEPSLVLLRTSRIDHDVAGPQSCCSVPRPNSILPLSIQTISAHLRDGSHEGLGLRRKEFQKPGASLSCARPAAPREAHNGIDAGWSDGGRPYPGCIVGLEDELGIEPGRVREYWPIARKV